MQYCRIDCCLWWVVPEQVQMHEPILTTTDAAKLKAEFESSYAELSKVGVPLSLVRALSPNVYFFFHPSWVDELPPNAYLPADAPIDQAHQATPDHASKQLDCC